MELYIVGGKHEFKTTDGVVISYLIHRDPVTGNYYSYGFDPNKESVEVAMGAFQHHLTEGTATRFNPDGGRLDGKDLT